MVHEKRAKAKENRGVDSDKEKRKKRRNWIARKGRPNISRISPMDAAVRAVDAANDAGRAVDDDAGETPTDDGRGQETLPMKLDVQ